MSPVQRVKPKIPVYDVISPSLLRSRDAAGTNPLHRRDAS